MFMKFMLAQNPYLEDANDPYATPSKICINIKNIDIVQQSGVFQDVPIEPRPGDNEAVVDAILDGGPRRPARVQRRRQVFVIEGDRFLISMKNGHNYTVMGNFDEFCDTLSHFRDKLETV
jgi:hypothetical protein